MAVLKRLIRLRIGVLFALPAGLHPAAALADETAPAVLAASCVACHGTVGHSAGPIPSLVGLEREDVEKLLLAYRSGEVESTVMGRISRGYTDAEIAALAEEVASWEH